MPAPNTFAQLAPSVPRTKERSRYRNLDIVQQMNTSYHVEKSPQSLDSS